MIQPSLMLLPLPLMQVSGMRPLCCPEASLAAPAPRTVAASGSPAPAPCVQIYTQPSNCKQLKDSSFFKRHIRKKTANYESPFNRPNIYYKKIPKRLYIGHTVPNPQAHAVSHSVAQGDQRQFSDWPSNSFFTSVFL